jgi:ketosteroid isomerase-like protein
MSAEENMALVRRSVDALTAGDTAALRTLLAPDHVLHELTHDAHPMPGTDDQPILDRYEQDLANGRVDFPDTTATIDEQFACGDRVVTITTTRGTHAASGRAIAVRGIGVDRIADGRIAESWLCGDRLGFYQQLDVVGTTRELIAQAGLTT